MSVPAAVPDLVGDLSRFGDMADRVELVVETQVARFRSGAREWLILPWSGGFYLFSEDNEGQRRGRELIQAFLGPSIALTESVTEEHLRANVPPSWAATGLLKASRLKRVAPGKVGGSEMLSRLEDLLAAVGGRTPVTLEIKPSHSDLLRDFRLALLNLDDDSARSLLDQILLTGRVSAENARYLRIEYLAAFGRWAEMHAMPHIGALLKARRPRAVSETLLRLVWWAELAGPDAVSPQQAFRERDVQGRYGALLRSVRVPSTPEGRSVAFLTAVRLNDGEWQSEILGRTATPEERAVLEALAVGVPSPETPHSPAAQEIAPAPAHPLEQAFRAGRLAEVVQTFVANPVPEHAEFALDAVLDLGEDESRSAVLRLVQGFVADGLQLSRRGRRDVEELAQSLEASCAGWLDWARRLAGTERWADGSTTLRNQHEGWEQLNSIGAQALANVCDSLLEASAGTNADQLRMSLDILCSEAGRLLEQGQANDFCQVVLALLSEQDNFSEMVRNAYLYLFAAWLGGGPTTKEYDEVLEQTLEIWNRIASPNAVDWACSALEEMLDAPSPNDAKRTSTAVVMLESVRHHANRLTLRQQVEIEGLASDFGLPVRRVEDRFEERSVWASLDGKYVGIYSLLTRAEPYLRDRLAQLCAVGEVKGNSDKVASQSLKSLAEKADYLVVDTWHAAHQATYAIDAIRPKDRQILPKYRGHSGFLRAIEEHLGG